VIPDGLDKDLRETGQEAQGDQQLQPPRGPPKRVRG